MKRILVISIALFFTQYLIAQDFSNKGSEFYLCFPNHVPNSNAVVNLSIYITSDAASTGNITMANGAFSGTYNLNAGNNYFQEIIIPSSTAEIFSSQSNTVTQKSIKVKKNAGQADVVVYAHQFAGARSAATLVLPTSVLGKKYYAFSYSQNGTDFGTNGEHLGRSQFQVIASKPNTVVQVTPKWNGVVQPSFTISLLNSGDIYQYQPVGASASSTDITGTYIESLASGTGGCLPIAVFSGSSTLTMNTNICSGGQNSFDPLWQEMYPVSTWGKNFGFIPFQTYTAGNPYRIMAADNNTVVSINAVAVATLNAGEIYPNTYTSTPILLNIPSSITADKPICVAQYAQKANCKGSGGNDGDPDMVILNPIEQNIDDITVFSTGQLAINSRYVNVLLKTIDVPNFKISKNGAPLTTPIAAWQTFTQLPGYSYLQESLNGISTARLVSDSGFNAIAYGFGNFESYAYSAGTNVKDLFTSYGTQSQYAIESGAVCTNSPFQFKISLPFKPDSIYWNLSGILNTPQYGIEKLPTIPNTILVPDSTTFVNGKPKYWYSLPNFYSFTNVGIYPLPVTLFSANSDGCGNIQEKETTLDVSAPPIANFNFSSPGCPLDPVQFTDATVSTKPNYIWNWNFGDPTSGALNTSTVENPVHLFVGSGPNFTVSMNTITTAGCFGSVSPKIVIIPALASATIAGNIAVCPTPTGTQNIIFTGTGGQLPYTFTYIPYINAVPGVAVNVNSDPGLPTKTLTIPTNATGVYRFVLTNVKNINTAICTRPITNQEATITVNPLPTATIAGTVNVCQNVPTQFITFTGSSSTAPYKFTYIPSINGVPGAAQTTPPSNAAGVYQLPVLTTVPGVYKFDLVSVVDAASTLCTNTAMGSATVTVQANPTATISTNAVAVCQDGTAPTITFTAANGSPNYTFNYTLTVNGTAVATTPLVTTNNTATLTVPLTTVGTLVYTLTSVTNSGVTNCTTNLTGVSTTVQVNPVPTATITGTTTVCQVAGPQTVTFIGAGGTSGSYVFNYTLSTNGGGAVAQTAITGNNIAISQPANVGVYVYEIVSVKDAVTNCIRNYTAPRPSVTITIQATSTATINGSTTVCQDATAPFVTFTAANGVAPFTFTYTLTTNGVTGAAQTVSSNPPTSPNIATFQIPMTTIGTLVYTLQSIRNTGTINCTTPIVGQTATFVINPIPTATITGTVNVCQNSIAPPITFIGAGGTGGVGASYVFNYTLNGIAQAPLTGNNIVVNQPTGIPNSYIYIITSVKDNATGCIKTYSVNPPTAVVTVKQLATATVITSVPTVCQNSTTLPTITFTATGGVAPYTFTYKINGGANLTTTTIFGNTKIITVPTNTAGTYIYSLVSVQESSVGGLCVNPQIGSAQVIVHPQPTASFTTAAPYCAFKDVTFTPSGSVSSGTITSWVWNYDNGTGANVRTDQIPFTINYPTAGVKNVTYKTISNLGCESVLFAAPVSINSKPKAGFISPESCLADAFAQFTDTSTVVGGTIVNWEWNFGDPGSPTNIISGSGPTFQNPQHAYATVGLKTVKLIVTSNSGCKDTVLAQSFFINGEVTSADFITQTPLALCSNRPVFIKENSVVNVGGLIRVEIYWDNANAPTVKETDELPTPGKIYIHNYPNVQVDRTYQIRYVAYTGFDGTCQKEVTKTITVRASPIAVFTAPLDVCLNGGPVVLNTGTATGGTGVYMGPGVTFAGGVYTFNPLAAGVVIGNTNNVTYAVTSPAGCDSALVRPIRVLAPPVVNTFTTVGSLCRINDITFRNTTTNGDGTIVKWIYDWGDGSAIQTFTTGADVTHLYFTAGPKTVTLTVETGYGCRNIPRVLNITVNPLPVPTYIFTNSACLPAANIVFTNTMANQTNFNYVWSFELPSTSAANTSVLPNPSHVYTNLGPHSTHLIATNNTTGCKDSTAIIVIDNNTIHPAPVVVFNPIPDVCLNNGTVIINQAIETSGIPLNGGAVYSGPGISLVGANYVFNPLGAGVIVGLNTITVTFTSTFNCPTVGTQTLRVLVKPVVNVFTTVGNKCEQNQTVFHNETTQGAGIITKWVYDWGDGSAIQTELTGADVTHFYSIANTYNATLYLITDYGCRSDVKPLSVVINALPKPNFIYSDTVCLPAGKVLFTNTSANTSNNTYSWIFNDVPATIKTTVNTDFTYGNIGPHPVKLIATNATTFCRDSITRNVTTIHPAPVAAFDFSLPSVCIGTSVSVIDRSTFADGVANKWEWNWGDGTLATGQSPASKNYGAAQTYNVVLKVTNSFGCFDDSIRAFTVHPFPAVNAGRDSIILEGGNLTLTPTVTGNDLTYLWTGTPAPINLSSATVLNPLAAPANDITYTLKATARGGCSKSDDVFIKVLKFPVIPNTFTPNNDGVHDFWVIKYLESYPDCRVQVFTRAGQLVFESRRYLRPWNGTTAGASLPFDTYYYIIEPGTGRKPITGYVTIVK